MKTYTLNTSDGFDLRYATSEVDSTKPWIAFAIPFGVNLEMARPFVDFFCPKYNVVTWEARSILDSHDGPVSSEDFAFDNHVRDLRLVLNVCDAKKFTIVGYCSGAGVALAAAEQFPEIVSNLILAHGEYVLLGDKGCTSQFATEIDTLLSLAAKNEDHLSLVFNKIKDNRFGDSSNRPDGIDLPFTRIEFLRRYSANYLQYKKIDFKNIAKNVSNKTFVMTGEKDLQSNVKSSEAIHSLLKNAEIYIDVESDHYELLREASKSMIKIWNYLFESRAYGAF